LIGISQNIHVNKELNNVNCQQQVLNASDGHRSKILERLPLLDTSKNTGRISSASRWMSSKSASGDEKTEAELDRADKGLVNCQQQSSDAPAVTEQQCDSSAFYCNHCDRGFNTEQKYNQHTDCHQKCSVKGCLYAAIPTLVKKHYLFDHMDMFNQYSGRHCAVEGCLFTADPKWVKLHYKLHHETGLANRMLLCYHDVAKWISEQKRNFPTAQNTGEKTWRSEEKEDEGGLHKKIKYSDEMDRKTWHDSVTDKLIEKTNADNNGVKKHAEIHNYLDQEPDGNNAPNASHGHESKHVERLLLLDTSKNAGGVSEASRQKSSKSTSGRGTMENIVSAGVERTDKGTARSDGQNSHTGLSVQASVVGMRTTAARSQYHALALEHCMIHKREEETSTTTEKRLRDIEVLSATRTSSNATLTNSKLQTYTLQQAPADFVGPTKGRISSTGSNLSSDLGGVTSADVCGHSGARSSSSRAVLSMADSSTDPVKCARKRHRLSTGALKAEIPMMNFAKAKVVKGHLVSTVRNLSDIPVYSGGQGLERSLTPLDISGLCGTIARPSASLSDVNRLSHLESSGLSHRC